jgi:hypothetical protein
MKTLEFGDMVFYATTGLILLLFWLRFLETKVGLWGAWCVWALWTGFLVRSYVKARRAAKIET